MAYIAWTAQVTSNRWLFLPGLVIAGAGMAGIWTPVYSLATRDLQPRFAGVASGVISTVQELGAVLGSAAIGALLQNQLANDLHNRAVSFATQLPAQAQGPFVARAGPRSRCRRASRPRWHSRSSKSPMRSLRKHSSMPCDPRWRSPSW